MNGIALSLQAAGIGRAGLLWRSTGKDRAGRPITCPCRASANYFSIYTSSPGIPNSVHKAFPKDQKCKTSFLWRIP